MLEKAPYDANDNLLDYPYPRGNITWKPNTSFAAKMTLESFSRGRSSAKFVWKDENGRLFPMFMTDMLDLVQNHAIDHGVVEGLWIVCKRGTNYGIKAVK